MNYGFASREHVDPFNAGRSWIFGAGDFVGGELWAEAPEDGDRQHVCTADVSTHGGAVLYRRGECYRGRELDVRGGRFQCFDGRRLHFTRPIIGGRRFSVIYYTLSLHGRTAETERHLAAELGFALPSPALPLPPPRGSPRPKAVGPAVLTCQVCGASFPSSSRFHRHIKSHTEPTFVCEVAGCGKGFRRREQLLRHAWTHVAEGKPCRCTEASCGKSFADAHSLLRHTQRVHGTGAGNKKDAAVQAKRRCTERRGEACRAAAA